MRGGFAAGAAVQNFRRRLQAGAGAQPASPRLIAGLSSSASAGPIGCTSGAVGFGFRGLAGFFGGVGIFRHGRNMGRGGGEKRANVELAAAVIATAFAGRSRFSGFRQYAARPRLPMAA